MLIVSFDLPHEIAKDDVVASEIVLTGYYERYNPSLSLIRNSTRRVLRTN